MRRGGERGVTREREWSERRKVREVREEKQGEGGHGRYKHVGSLDKAIHLSAPHLPSNQASWDFAIHLMDYPLHPPPPHDCHFSR